MRIFIKNFNIKKNAFREGKKLLFIFNLILTNIIFNLLISKIILNRYHEIFY